MSGLDLASTNLGDRGDLGVDRERGRLGDRSGGPGDGRGDPAGLGADEDEALTSTQSVWVGGGCCCGWSVRWSLVSASTESRRSETSVGVGQLRWW